MRVVVATSLAGLVCLAAASATEASFVAVPRTDTPPQIDGSLSPDEWSSAAVTCGFRDNGTGLPARAPVVISLCYDGAALYCLFECRGEAPGGLKGGAGERDSSIWSGSDAEVFIAPEQWPQERYAHFMINHTDTIADEMCEAGDYDGSWDPDWRHAAWKTEDAWLAEMAIPWSSLALATPREGQVFRANFARNAASIQELSTWAAVRGGFHHPGQFGTLVLAGAGPAAALDALPDRRTGPIALQGRLIGEARGVTLSAAVMAGERPREHRYSQPFVESATGRGEGSLQFEIPDGARSLEVSVRDAARGVLWRQTVELDLPAFGPRIRAVRAMLERLMREDGALEDFGEQVMAQLSGLRARLDEVEAAAREPLDADGLGRVREEIEQVGRQINDLAMVAQAGTLGGAGEMLPSYVVTNPVCTRKVQPTAVDPGPPAGELRLAMARGEYEPIQIVVCAVTGDLHRLRVSAGSLSGPDGHVIPAVRVVVNPVGFVHCKISTQGARLTGEVPDVLLSQRAMDVRAGRRQPFFITVQTTPEDAPGEYRGHVWVRARDAATMKLPLTVRVYDVALPVRSHLRTAFVLWNQGVGRFAEGVGADAFMDAYLRYSKVMLAHRISPITMWRLEKGEDGAWDFSNFDRYLSELVPLGLTTVNIGGNGYLTKDREVEGAKAVAAHLRERGWWHLHYVYGQDEAPKSAADTLRNNYSALVEAVPDLRIMQTGWSPRPELKGLVRIWCPLTATADLEAGRAARAEGDEVWWYVCCGPIAPYANLFVDYPGVDHRILGWMTYRAGIEGFLYWGVNVWPNAPPLAQYDEANYANWNPNSYSTINGDGYLLYPGKGDTAVPSLRLALLRDGFEDYDLFTEVAALAARRGGRLAERARELLRFEAPLITSLSSFTQDGADLLARREEILRAGEGLAADVRGAPCLSTPGRRCW